PQGGTLVAGVISDVKSLNYYVAESRLAQDIIDLMFLSLTTINPDLKTFSPLLAKSWEFSDDRKTLTFHLRDDVYWWDGEKTTAEDVAFTHRIITHPEVTWSGKSWKEHIENVEAVDDTTVVYQFSRVYPYQLMDAAEGVILPEHLLQDVPSGEFLTADFNSHPVGNGPFRFSRWEQQQQLELIRNEHYYEESKPHLDRIVFRIVPDRTTLITQLQAGEIDFVEDMSPRNFQQTKQNFKDGNSDIKIYEYLGRNYDYIAWNTIDPDAYDPNVHATVESFDQIPNPYFADKRVRQAMTYAINRDLIREAIGYGLLIPMHGAISPILWAHDESIPEIPYDPDEARTLLADAGWQDVDDDGLLEKDGRDFRFTIKTNTGNVRREQTCTLIQDMLKQVGIQMEIQLLEGLTFFNSLRNKQFDAALSGWSVALKVDYAPIFHSQAALKGYNFTAYRNPLFDSLNREAAVASDTEKAKKLWSQVESLLLEDQPYTWLYYMKSGHGLHERFKGVRMDHRGAYLNLEDWWVPVEERKYWVSRAQL
ncbi:MAG TPA: peptide-binding protein, partial [bacterium]|nr:peptide-binding protein [bacterium]